MDKLLEFSQSHDSQQARAARECDQALHQHILYVVYFSLCFVDTDAMVCFSRHVRVGSNLLRDFTKLFPMSGSTDGSISGKSSLPVLI